MYLSCGEAKDQNAAQQEERPIVDSRVGKISCENVRDVREDSRTKLFLLERYFQNYFVALVYSPTTLQHLRDKHYIHIYTQLHMLMLKQNVHTTVFSGTFPANSTEMFLLSIYIFSHIKNFLSTHAHMHTNSLH